MMLKSLRLPKFRRKSNAPATAQGERIYAIGDIHGRLDLLEDLLAQIHTDNAGRASARTTFVFLGDLVDRGPNSRGVVERLMRLAEASGKDLISVVFLKGNHEELLIKAYRGDRQAARLLNRVGGRETLLSYGVTAEEYDAANIDELLALMTPRIPERHIAFLDGFTDWYESGRYLFVHAGIRPDVPLANQRGSDLRWIRREFLEWSGDLGYMVVHGHSISEEVDERSNRIGIDTGAYVTGRLTALAVEGSHRWYLKAEKN